MKMSPGTKNSGAIGCPLAMALCLQLVISVSVRAQVSAMDRTVDSLLVLMTLEEKCGQVNQIVAQWKDGISYLTEENKEMIRRGRIGSLLGAAGASPIREMQRIAVDESRLRIPLMFGIDVIHGARTIFPVPIGEASTWDPELVEKSARVAAFEASAQGIQWTFAPMVDIARDPRWGRMVEGSGEDPYLGSVMAAARVRGFQGKNLSDSTSIMACAKHFAAYGGAEAGRDYNTVDISERTLRDVYLPPYKAAVDAGVGSLMTSFNEIAGVPSSGSKFLMTDVLRGEWGFKGFVVSDWTAVAELIPHGVAATRADAGQLAISAGVDMDMMSNIYLEELPDLVRKGIVAEDVLNEAVRRVLKAKYRLGLFRDPYRGISPEREKRSILTPENLKTALEVARKSIVLLKNENALLPLSKQLNTIAVIGPLADNKHDPLGPWNAGGRDTDVVTVLEGLKQKISPQTRLHYVMGCEIEGDSGYNASEAVKVAKQADVAILVVGESIEMSGEAASRSNIDLPGRQKDLIKAVYETGTPVVLVLMNGRPLTISWEAETIPAILETWFLGVQTGNAIADVLFGDVNPSGKVPVTFPRSVGQIPIYYNHKNTGRPFIDPDKYTSKYLDVANTPLYPFGYGLSYTSFSYSNLTISPTKIGGKDSVTVSVLVKNAGKRDGDEVVQLYVQDVIGSVTRPVKELKGFRRVALKSGESRLVQFILRPAD
ncbi:MAG: glycoside hydrolase family 3 protein, partial [Bacteroidetes bacterium]|nr:glycoside hydrolase family 3 protein [Bacteroidota bacterium]